MPSDQEAKSKLSLSLIEKLQAMQLVVDVGKIIEEDVIKKVKEKTKKDKQQLDLLKKAHYRNFK